MEVPSQLTDSQKPISFWKKNSFTLYIILLALFFLSAWIFLFIKLQNGSVINRTSFIDDENLTKFPNAGVITESIEPGLLIIPKGKGRPFYASVAEKDLYLPDDFQIVDIPAIPNRIKYVAGNFESWEGINDTNDKLIVLTNPNDKSTKYYFRVSFENSDLFGDNPTALSVENTDQITNKIMTSAIIVKKNIIEIGFDNINKLIEKGDVVIIEPLHNLNLTTATDSGNRLLARHVIIRREGGVNAVEKRLGIE